MKILSIGSYAKYLGISKSTVYRYLKSGKIKESFKTDGKHRRFIVENNKNKVVLYSRVSSHDQKKDLITQNEKLIQFAKKNYTNYEVESILDLGSGINFNKKGLNKLILMIINKDLSVLVINHKERLLRFGFELINQICILNNIKIVIIEEQKNKSFEFELSENIIEIMTVFCAKLYGKRSNKNKAVLNKNEICLQ
jgi:putative resolvase